MKNPLHFESREQPVVSRAAFAGRLLYNGLWGAGVIAVSLLAGMLGYHACEGMNLLDSFVNAAMILSGMGPVGALTTVCGKVFAGFYALYSGLVLIAVSGLVLAPVFHRVLHRFHVEQGRERN